MKCKDCRSYDPKKDVPGADDHTGQCRAHPPTPVCIAERAVASDFPLVGENMWCSEFGKKVKGK